MNTAYRISGILLVIGLIAFSGSGIVDAASQVGPTNSDTILSGWANPAGLPPATVDFGNLIVKTRTMTTTFTAADCPPDADFLNPQGNGKVEVLERDFALPPQFQKKLTSLPFPYPEYEMQAASEDDITSIGTLRIAARGVEMENGRRVGVIRITETPIGVRTSFDVFAYYPLALMPMTVMGMTAKHFPSATIVRQDSNVITIKMCKERASSSSSSSSGNSSSSSSSSSASSTYSTSSSQASSSNSSSY